MAEQTGSFGTFRADFVYTEDILADFETLYQVKQRMSPLARVLCLTFGAVGAIYFGYSLYTDGLGPTRIGYLIVCSLMILVGCSGARRSGSDETLKKYRKYYTDRRVSFLIDENGVEMRLEKQKSYAKSKFQQIYALYETERCYYFVIKGKAYYILSKAAIKGGTAEELKKYMEQKCKKKFQFYDLGAQAQAKNNRKTPKGK